MNAVPWFKDHPPHPSQPSLGGRVFIFAFLAIAMLSQAVLRADIVPPGCLGNGYGISLFVDKQKARVGDTLLYSLLVNNLAFPACRAEQITASVITPDGVTNRVTLKRSTLNPGESDFYENVITYVIRAQDVKADGVVRGSSISSAIINQNIINENSENFRDVNTIITKPCISIAATCNGAVGETGAITFNGTVKNCGDSKLVGINVSNLVNGATVLVAGPFDLEAGQERAFTGSYVPAQPCNPSTAVLTATGSDTLAAAKSFSASTPITCSSTLTPSLALTTSCAPAAAAPGQPLSYSGAVKNTGNVTLTDIVVLADKPVTGTSAFKVAKLAPGETATFTGSYTAPVACESTVAFAASAKSVCSQPTSASSSITCPIATTPQVGLTSACPVAPVAPGAVLSYSGVVSNPGNVGLKNVKVFSARTGSNPVFSADTLAPGASVNFNASYTAPLDTCISTDTLTVIGQDTCANRSVTNIIATACPLVVAPKIEVASACPTVAPAPGAALNYTGTVRNTGNITLTNIVVVSDRPVANTVVFRVAALAPGATASFTGSFTAPTDTCAVVNTLTASSQNACSGANIAATSSSSCAIATTPKLAITRECSTVVPLAGTAIEYSGVVQNVGNVTLTNVVVVSDRPTANTVIATIPSLAPGATANYKGSYVTAADTCSTTDTVSVSGRDVCSNQSTADSKTGTCPLRTAGSVKIAIACPTSPATAGTAVTYSGVITNPGEVTLNNIVVVNDAVPGTPVFSVASLAPKASVNFNAAVTTPANTCSVTSSFTVTASERCGTGGIKDTAAATCPLVTTPAIVVAHDCPAVSPAPGATATFSGSVRNSGNVTLNNVVVKNGAATVYGPASLDPGATATFTGTYTVPADVCSVVTTLTASGVDKCENRTVTGTSAKECPVKTAPAITLTKECPTTPVAAGALITYTGVIRNTGNVTLLDVVVNSGNDRVFGPATLAPGATATVTGSTRAPENACVITDTWTVTGRDKCSSATVTQSATSSCPVATAPKLNLTLSCPSESLTPGSTVKYSGVVSNPGSITLTNISVINDAIPGTAVFTTASLAPGASANFTVSVTVPADVCSVTANITANANGQCDGTVAQKASATCPVTTAPAIAITHSCPTEITVVGFASSYAGKVTNTGNVTLTNVVVLNSLTGGTPVFGPATLAPGQSADFTGTYTLSDKTEGCTFESRVSVTAADKCSGRSVNAEHRSTCPIQSLPGLEITFKCPERQYSQGDTFTYRAVIKNIGSVRLENVKVFDTLTGNRLVWSRDSLTPGESHEMENYPIVPENCCAITTTLRAEAIDVCSKQPVVDTTTGTCPVLYHPKIAVTKTCPTRTSESGQTLAFSGTITNPGDVTLMDVNLVNIVNGKETKILGPIALAPGQVVNYKSSFVVPDDFCGDNTVKVTGQAFCGTKEVVSASDSTRCPVTTMPMIVVTKTCPTAPVAKGDIFTYSGSVMNAGNVTLVDVLVYDSRPAPKTLVYGPVTLAPGETKNFTGSYKLDTICCEVWDTLTAVGKDRCSGVAVENTATALCPVLWTAKIEVTKQCRPDNSFTGVVRNTGAITLTNVTVVAQLAGANAAVLGPIELAPGETATFKGKSAGDSLIIAKGTSLCQTVDVVAQANCAGPVAPPPLSISKVTVSNGGATLHWQSVPGRFYLLEYKRGLQDANWQSVPGEIQATDTETTKQDSDVSDVQKLYRVRILD